MTSKINILIIELREMIDNIAHDLRSPIGRIRIISEGTLSSNNAEVDYKAAASDTLEECDRLIHLINTTLDVAEADAQIDFKNREDVNLTKIICDTCELFEPAAAEKNICLSHSIDNSCSIIGLKSNLQRMIANLLDNAIKYTNNHGNINIKLTKQTSNYEIHICDDGIGVQESEQSRIFDRFYRCDQSRTKDGCGLGLSFARAVAQSHGGNISITSQIDHGSTFIVTLPYNSTS